MTTAVQTTKDLCERCGSPGEGYLSFKSTDVEENYRTCRPCVPEFTEEIKELRKRVEEMFKN